MKKKVLSALLVLALLIGCMPIALAAETSGTCGENATWSFDEATGTLTISGTGAMYDYEPEGEASNTAPWYGFSSDITHLVIGEGITSIGSEAFCDTKLGYVDLSQTNITAIGENAFALSDLTGIKLPNSMTEIGRAAFQNATNLESVEIPDSVTTIHPSAFYLCSLLDSLTIPASVTSIGNIAFCMSANNFYFEGDVPQMAPQMVVGGEDGIGGYLQKGTFALCYSCTVYYPENNPTWNDEVFNTNWGSEITWIGYTPEHSAGPAPAFTDVAPGAYYEDAVAWAVENGITNGTSATTFSPNQDCIRAQVVTFLWRAAGKPEPQIKRTDFTDVDPNGYYAKAVAWAVENGITNGVSADKFGTFDPCTRGQVVTFLWRAAHNPVTAPSTNPFKDVLPDDFYYDAVLWAAGEGITSGTTETTFSPASTCNRAQIVTFLYRYING